MIALAQTGHDLIAWGDHAIVEGETIRAWAGHQLLGTYSRYGWHHPGPALFYWMAPWHELFGRSPAALNASVAFLNAVMVAAVVAVTGRRAGRVAALWAAALAGLYIVQQGPTLVRDFWVPHAVVFPFAALIVLTAAAATGSVELLPLVALIASFLASTDVSVAPATAVVVTAGVAVFVALRSWRTLHRPRRRWLAIGAATLLATALVWYPPVYQQLKPGPGNLNTLRKFFGQSAPGHTLREGIDAVSNSFSVLVGGGRHELDAVPASTGAHVFLLLTLVLLVAGIVVGWRRQRMFAMALCVTALAALLAEIYAVTAIRGEVFTYLVDWSGAAAIAAWLGIGCALAPGDLRTKRISPALAIGVVAGLVAIWGVVDQVAHASLTRDPAYDNRVEKPVALAVRRWVAAHRVKDPELLVTSPDQWPIVAGVYADRLRHGERVAIDPVWLWVFGEQNAPTGHEDASILFLDNTQPKPRLDPGTRKIAALPRGTVVYAGPPVRRR